MIEAQVISKILEEKNLDILLDENINSTYFITYSEEARFIFGHYSEYRTVPTKETFLGKFNDFEFTSTKEDWKYLITGLREGYMFNQLAILSQLATITTPPIANPAAIKRGNIYIYILPEFN